MARAHGLLDVPVFALCLHERANCPRPLLSLGSPDSKFLDIFLSLPPSRSLADPRSCRRRETNPRHGRHLQYVAASWSRRREAKCRCVSRRRRSRGATPGRHQTIQALCRLLRVLDVSKTVLPLSRHTDPSPKRTPGLHSKDMSRASFPHFATSASQALTSPLDNVCRNNETKKRDTWDR